MKDLRRMLLRRKRRPFVDEKIAHRDIRIAQIRTKYIFAEEIRENAAGGMFPKKIAALVPGAIKFRKSAFRVRFQITKKRRQKTPLVFRGCRFDMFRRFRHMNDGNAKRDGRFRNLCLTLGKDERGDIRKIRRFGGNDVPRSRFRHDILRRLACGDFQFRHSVNFLWLSMRLFSEPPDEHDGAAGIPPSRIFSADRRRLRFLRAFCILRK